MEIILKAIIDEDFNDYKKNSMFLGFPTCTWKCEKECGEHCCQNSALAQAQDIGVSIHEICSRYLNNNITQAIVCGGLEPMDSFDNLYMFILYLRRGYNCSDDIVIYTGYTKEECVANGWIEELCPFGNIIIKFGRFIPNQPSHYDEVLEVELASENQFAERIC